MPPRARRIVVENEEPCGSGQSAESLARDIAMQPEAPCTCCSKSWRRRTAKLERLEGTCFGTCGIKSVKEGQGED